MFAVSSRWNGCEDGYTREDRKHDGKTRADKKRTGRTGRHGVGTSSIIPAILDDRKSKEKRRRYVEMVIEGGGEIQ